MPTIVNGIALIPSFNPTGNPGEYTFAGAEYNTQSDFTGSGAYLITVGFVLYVPATDVNSGTAIPGVVHRYRLTDVSIQDPGTFSGTMLWDELGDELDSPTSGANCIVAEATPKRGLGLPVDPLVYQTLPPGVATGAYNVDTQDILDKSLSGGTYKFVQSSTATQWTVVHNQGSSDFLYTLFDSNGVQVIPDAIIAVSDNEVQVNVLEAMAGKLILVFID